MFNHESNIPTPQHRRASTRGFSLLTVLLWVVLLGLVSLLLQLRLTDQLETLPASERRLYALNMAQSGLELARVLLPALDVNQLLVGRDGVFAGTGRPEWRNPLPWDRARYSDPDSHVLTPDDGLPSHLSDGSSLQIKSAAANGGRFFIRFTNNPEEPPDEDRDGVVIVRSLGVARSRLPALSLGGIIHSTSLAEARLRQERVFDLDSALTLFADRGDFRWRGDNFWIRGGTSAVITLISEASGSLQTDLDASLTPAQRARIEGATVPDRLDRTDAWRQSIQGRRIFDPEFWSHFQAHLPRFAEPVIPGFRYLPEGGVIREEFAGIVAARGRLQVGSGGRIRGLLLHLGAGPLELSGDARIEGAVWMSQPEGRPLELEVSGDSQILYDREAVTEALRLIPPTQLGWRLLFPEMVL